MNRRGTWRDLRASLEACPIGRPTVRRGASSGGETDAPRLNLAGDGRRAADALAKIEYGGGRAAVAGELPAMSLIAFSRSPVAQSAGGWACSRDICFGAGGSGHEATLHRSLCGSRGWTDGFLAEGYDVVGFVPVGDVESVGGRVWCGRSSARDRGGAAVQKIEGYSDPRAMAGKARI